jgi:prepilin-type N-terminal cleavage/methylation domain-containing protein
MSLIQYNDLTRDDIFMKQMNHKGITFIELAVVLVIIAIGAALWLPNIAAWLPNYRLRSAAQDVVSTMRTAQMRAVANNIQYRVNFNAGEIGATNSYILQRNSGGMWINDGAVQTFPAGIAVNIDQLPAGRAVFNLNSTSTAGSVTLQNAKGAQRRITLTSATGRVRIE